MSRGQLSSRRNRIWDFTLRRELHRLACDLSAAGRAGVRLRDESAAATGGTAVCMSADAPTEAKSPVRGDDGRRLAGFPQEAALRERATEAAVRAAPEVDR